MMSSWLSVPRWLWKDAPALRVIRWLRPFGSVSWTASPGMSGPCRGLVIGRLYPSERELDVTGGQHAVPRTGGLDQELLGSGSAADRVEQRQAGQVGRQYQARLERAGQRARLQPGGALLGGGHHRGLVEDRDRLVVVIHDHHRAGLILLGTPDRLGHRGV